jgi:hypothetical protein
MRGAVAILGFMLALAGAAHAQDFGAGRQAFNRKDYAEALKQWRPLAEAGNAEAQHALGMMYSGGFGVPKDMTQAIAWYLKAAEQGRAHAQYLVAAAYLQGIGVERDPLAFARWCHRAAEQGHPPAQFLLGMAHHQGLGVPVDPVQAYLWYSLAAAQGHAQAMDNLVGINAGMSDAQKAEGARLVREWKPAPER